MAVFPAVGDPGPYWFEYVGAFGGFLAAATAVGIAGWSSRRDRKQRPRLELLYDHSEGEDFAVGLNDGTQHWVRLRVLNAPGRRSADDVEVVVAGVNRADGEPIGRIHGFTLVWSNTWGTDGLPVTRLAIPPGVARRVDLLSLKRPVVSDCGGGARPAQSEGGHDVAGELEVHPRPRGGSAFFGAGTYTILLAVTARDTDAVFYSVDVEFDGLWWSAENIRDHLKMSEPSRTRKTTL